MKIQGGSNMTGTDLCVNKPHLSRSYLNHLVNGAGKHRDIYWIRNFVHSGDNAIG